MSRPVSAAIAVALTLTAAPPRATASPRPAGDPADSDRGWLGAPARAGAPRRAGPPLPQRPGGPRDASPEPWRPPPDPATPGVPAWLEGAPGTPRPSGHAGYPTKKISARFADARLGDIVARLGDLVGLPGLEVPLPHALRKCSLAVQDADFEQVLEVLMMQHELSLWLEGGRLRCLRGMRMPPRRPPTDAELARLRRPVTFRAKRMDLAAVTRHLGRSTGLLVGLPVFAAKMKVTVSLGGNLAQALEVLGAVSGYQIWLDGRYLRFTRGAPAADPAAATRLESPRVSLRARDRAADSVLRALGSMLGRVVVAPASAGRFRVDLAHRDAPPAAIFEDLSRQTGLDVFVDGPFLRAQRRPYRAFPRPPGDWRAYDAVLAEDPARDRPSRPDAAPPRSDDLADDHPADDFGDF